MRKSIVIVSENFPSEGRPVFVFVQQLVFALVDLGAKISVIAPQSLTHSLIRREKLLPIHSVEKTKNGKLFDVYRPYCFTFGTGHKILYKLANIFNEKSLFSTIKKIRPEILYGHFWHTAYKLKPFAQKYHIPLFVACGEGDNALEELVGSLSKKELLQFKKTVSGVISVSSENKRKCKDYGLAEENDIVVLPNCVDDSLFHPFSSTALREKLGVNPTDFLLIFVGGFIYRKGPERVVKAVEKINDQRLKMIFVGKSLKGDISDPIHPNIVFKGLLEHSELPKYLNAADFFVLPTLKEGCCNAIVESLACGIPVISANKPFNDDILNEKNSIRVNPENVDEISLAISKLINYPELLGKMKEYTKRNSNNYSIVTRAKNILGFIEQQTNK